MLQVEGVSSGYGNLHILHEVSLEAVDKEVTVIVGPNGSGKSTLLKTIAGLATLYEGKIAIGGKQITKLPPHDIAKMGLAYLPQTESVFVQLTVAENIKMAGYTIPDDEMAPRLTGVLNMFPQLERYMKTRVQNLSGGERQMVAMSMALLRKPSVIMFDEPTANLSPKLATQVLKTVETVAKELGLTVLLVEQNAKRALEIGDKAYLLVGGRNAFKGTAKELLTHEELAKLYLGMKTTSA
ncbi:MAG TPA: ABC transporter ATP-binding protein [Nitrososphaerales archaeon]|nr:ABC transporter ATP-binding protein [Nitrososphaerales archaeon]